MADFGMADCKPVVTPLPEKLVLTSATDDKVLEAHSFPYLQAIGSVMYAMLGMRPDIAYAVSTLSCFSSQPGPKHVQALKHLLQYLKGSADFGIVYSHDGGTLLGSESKRILHSECDSLVGFTDSDYTMDPESQCSISSSVFLTAGGPVSWQSKLQSSLSQSSTEAKYLASSEAAKEAVWLCQLL